jgi:hypothetical protein
MPRLSILLILLSIVGYALILCTVRANNTGASCANAQIGFTGGQDSICQIDSAYCNYVNVVYKQCGTCRVMQATPVAGGSCDCDARTSYCSQKSDQGSGQCLSYTMLNQFCTMDSDCQTTVTRSLPSGGSVQLPDEHLFCVNSACKPCNPATWNSGNVTCPGYSATLSSSLGRYATTSRLSAVVYTCLSNGDIVFLQDTVDYDYGYPCGNRALWPQNCNPSPSPSLAASPSASKLKNSGAGSLTPYVVAVVFILSFLAALHTALHDE